METLIETGRDKPYFFVTRKICVARNESHIFAFVPVT